MHMNVSGPTFGIYDCQLLACPRMDQILELDGFGSEGREIYKSRV